MSTKIIILIVLILLIIVGLILFVFNKKEETPTSKEEQITKETPSSKEEQKIELKPQDSQCRGEVQNSYYAFSEEPVLGSDIVKKLKEGFKFISNYM
jgi:hypothetical protein